MDDSECDVRDAWLGVLEGEEDDDDDDDEISDRLEGSCDDDCDEDSDELDSLDEKGIELVVNNSSSVRLRNLSSMN